MHIHVIPFHHSFGLTPLTYHVPQNQRKEISVWSLVYVPWRNDEDIALVIQIVDDSDVPDLQDIKSTIRPECSVPLLALQDITLLIQILQKYLIPLHKALQFLVPLPILSRYEKQSYLDVVPVEWEQDKAAVFSYEHIPSESDIFEKCQDITSKESTVIIVPHAYMLSTHADKIGQASIIDDPRHTPAKQFKSYNAILKQEYSVVIGTRKTLLRRIGWYKHIIYLHDALSPAISFYHYQVQWYWLCQRLHELWKHVTVYTNTPVVSNMYEHLMKTKKQ